MADRDEDLARADDILVPIVSRGDSEFMTVSRDLMPRVIAIARHDIADWLAVDPDVTGKAFETGAKALAIAAIDKAANV